jgi:hypothetical protein
MFTGMSTLDGLPEIEFSEGGVAAIAIKFSANVLRGTYICNIHLVDSLRVWPPVILNGVASFIVTETTRVAGCVELSPEYRIDSETMVRVTGLSIT